MGKSLKCGIGPVDKADMLVYICKQFARIFYK